MDLLPENIVDLSAITTDEVYMPSLLQQQSTLSVLRLDKIDPVISGNKWFKLKLYLASAKDKGQKQLVTFGGAYSNHIIATACAAAKAGFTSVGFIRGEEPAALSHTLNDAMRWGMQLRFLSRTQYNQKNDPAFIQELLKEYPESCIIPEGGQGELGEKGAADIHSFIKTGAFTHIICAVGTGTLLLGLARVPTSGERLIGIPVLKGFADWAGKQKTGTNGSPFTIVDGYHFGGYAKYNSTLLHFMNDWFRATGIPSDIVYTGKLFFAANDLLNKNYFPSNSRLLLIHSGGLQGNKSMVAKSLVF